MSDEKNLGGRPKVFDDPEKVRIFESGCQLMPTVPEMAAIVGCSEDTIERYSRERWPDQGFAGALKEFGGRAKMSLRRAQYKNAVENMNTTMQVWLGKNWLGQTDSTELKLPDAKISVKYNLDD